nr:TPA_asm: ND5 [Baikalogammarus pullus]
MNLKIYSCFSAGLVFLGLVFTSAGLSSVVYEGSIVVEWEVWSFSSVLVSMSVVLDWMSLFFLGSVCLISGSVSKYSEYYMEGEVNLFRFMYILVMFVSSMGLMIVSPNMVSLLLGWDGLGLTSYALVIFYQSESSCNAGMLTVLMNRVGDVAILLSISLLFVGGCWDFYSNHSQMSSGAVLLVVLACMTKSAQMPFSAWLPAAMAAPTPVSALVHSSTLVTAGVYLAIRFSEVLTTSGVAKVLLGVSLMTMVMAGWGAMVETDIKKVVALSTLSQLGLMIVILSAGMKELAFFHLIMHAMFKSTLFLCMGVVIHGAGGTQDSRSVSGFNVSSPSLGVVLSATNLALCGFPFLGGFYSKDPILEYMFMSSSNFVVCAGSILGTGLTVGYSLRVLYLSSYGVSNLKAVSETSDMGEVVSKSITFLFGATLVSGFMLHWAVMPLMSPFYLSGVQKYYVLVVSVLVSLIVLRGMEESSSAGDRVSGVLKWLSSSMWFMALLSSKFVSEKAMFAGLSSVKSVDSGWLEYYGAQGGGQVFMPMSGALQKSQAGVVVGAYLVSGLLGVLLLVMVV